MDSPVTLDLYLGLAVGVACVLLCTASITDRLRREIARVWTVLDCTFCTSIWLSLAAATTFQGEMPWILRVGAVAAVANTAVLVIHMSISTVQEDENEPDASDS